MSGIKVAARLGLYKWIMGTIGLIGGLAWLSVAAFAEPLAVTPPEPARRAELVHLLRHDCGSCHGLTLKGGLGPALTKEALADKAPVMLREVILHGRPGTPMPPWRGFLTKEETDWLVEILIQGRLDAEK